MRRTDSISTLLKSPRAEGKRSSRRRWLWLALLALLMVQGVCFVGLPMAANAGDQDMLPVSLRALDEADYSADAIGTSQPQLQFAIVGDVLRDVDPEATDIELRLSALEEAMQTPVATDTEPTEVVASTLTPTETPTSEPSSTVTASSNGTASPSATTTEGPSQTPTATPTLSASATATPSPSPTRTRSPSQTPSASPSATATPTPTTSSVSCTEFSLSGFRVDGQEVAWDLNNGSGTAAEISTLFIAWPGDNEQLAKIELGGDAIWDQKDGDPPTDISGGWKSGESRTVGARSSKVLLFQFDEESSNSSSSYNLRIDLDNGCRVTS